MNRPAPTAPPRKCRAESRAVLIALLYAAAAALWIALSDSALATLARDPEQFLRFETYKGWLFVGVTALLLFLLMRWQFGELLAMQAASRRNEERLHSVLASIDDLVFVFDPDYRFVECYQPNEEKLLVPVAQFLGRRIDAIGLPPDVAARFIEAIDAAGREGAVSTVHYPLDVPVGKRWFSASLSRLEDGRGNFSGVTAVVRDITPLKQVEEAARSAQLLSDTLLDSLPSIFFVIDADGRLLRWNRVLETTTGRSADELAGCDALLLLPETARGAAARHVATAFEAGETQAELPLLDREQREIPHFFIAHRIVLEGRVCALGIGTDISERLISERRLLASEQRFRSLLTDIPNIAVQGYDADRRVIFWNPASERLYGYARDEALGRSLEDLIIPEAMRRTVVDLHHRWIEHGIPIPSGELDLRHKNGGSVPVYSSHALIRNSQNDLEMYCIDIDVQEARQAQSQLRLAAQVFDGSGEAILITDADKRILAVNTAFTRITGYDKEEILGRAPEYLSSGYHDAGFYQQMWHELHETGHWQGEIWNRRKNGETYPEWLGISAVRDDGGALTHYVGIFADISERKAIEAKLEGLIEPVLIGPPHKIAAAAEKAGVSIEGLRIEATEHSHAAAAKAVELASSGAIRALMKGSLHTDELLGAVVAAQSGLRTERRISHVYVLDVPSYPKPLIVTDAAINIMPTLEQKRDICQNAIDLMHVLGVAEPLVAVLAAVETVNPAMPATLEAAALTVMAARGQITGAKVDGPLAFDNAINLDSARIKEIVSPVAGRADILVVPNLEAGNMLAKQLIYLAGADAAGLVLGARVPIILTSRSDTLRVRLVSAALAKLVAEHRTSATA